MGMLRIGMLEDKPSMMFGRMGGDSYEVYTPFRTIQKKGNTFFRVIASCKNVNVAEDAKAEIQFFLRRTRKIKPGEPDTFGVFLMGNEVEKVMGVMGMISYVAFGIVSISLLVGGIGIMNIMLVSVTERTREIGIRKAIGAHRRDILVQFLLESMVLSLLGGAIGVLLGWLITQGASAAFGLTMVIDLQTVILSASFAAAVGLIFGIYPAWRASRLQPIEALRYE